MRRMRLRKASPRFCRRSLALQERARPDTDATAPAAEGAEAAVARINLDGEPPASLCEKIKTENNDVYDLQLVTL